MKKFIIKSAYFIVFFAIFFVAVNALYFTIITSTDWDCRKRYESLKFLNPDYELLVLGASLALDGIDTELLTSKGIKSYNLALGGGSLRTSYIQLEEYLKKYKVKPKTALLGINSTMEAFSDTGIHPIVEFTMDDFRFGINDAPILKFKWLGFEFLKKVVSSKHREAKLVLGQLKFKKIIPDRTSATEYYLDVQKLDSLEWMGNLAKLCSQNNVELIVLDMPSYKANRNMSETGPYTLCFANGDSAKLYNFNNLDFCEIFDADKDWIGNSHLNEFGAVKFTNEIMSILKE